MQRRKLAAALALLPALAACGLRPIYAQAERATLLPTLAAIEVGDQPGSRGQYFRNALLDQLNPEGIVVPPEYDLEVRLRQESNSLAIQLDNSATRYNLVLGADFVLKRRSDGQILYNSATRRVVSYNERGNPFATLIAEQDAARRAAQEVARQIRVMLSLYFAEQTA